MASVDYLTQLDELRSGKRDEIHVTPEEFSAFRQVWTNYPARKEIVGMAGRGGGITYHYQSPNRDEIPR